MKGKTFRYCLKVSLPVMAGYVVLGIGFGILSAKQGYAWYYSLFMSLFIYAGSMQYVGIELLSTGVNFITFALMTLVVNARHLFYGLTMLPKYRKLGKSKSYVIFALTDETFSLVCQDVPSEINAEQYYLYVSLLNQLYWVGGSVLGAVVGSVLPFDTTGIEFSMTALFCVIVVEQWEQGGNHFATLVGLGIALLCLFLFDAKHFLIPTLICITLVLLLDGKRKGAFHDE